MSDNFIRHLVSFLGFLIALLIFAAGYISGTHRWWWAVIGSIFIYLVVYKLVEV